ncbi:MAG: molybdopterin-binding protein [Alphaproteobacteria bacterium]
MQDRPPETDAAQTEIVTAAVLVIGDEILSGRTKDTNIATIAQHLTSIGIRLCEARVVADDQAAIIAALDALRTRYDYVFSTGGIGPTHDDITTDSVARAFGVAVETNQRAVAMMREFYPESELTPSRLRMTRIPVGAELIENPVSKAPGFMIGNVAVMAGIPRIMTAMLKNVTSRLRTGEKLLSLSIHAPELESNIAEFLSATQIAFPDVMIGSYPYSDERGRGTYLTLRAVSAERLRTAATVLIERIREAGWRCDDPE